MSRLVDFPLQRSNPSVEPRTPFDAVRHKIPEWLASAPLDMRKTLRQAGQSREPWVDEALRTLPDVAQALRQEHELYRFNEQKLTDALTALPALEAFAEPLLVAALKERFALDVDVRQTWLFHARRVQVDNSFAGASKDPFVELQQSINAATQPLLHCALQNFETWEIEPGAMDVDARRKAAIYGSDPRSGRVNTEALLPIAPHAFAALCRELNLGGMYQQKISAFFNPPSAPGDAPDAAAFNRRGLLKRCEQSAYAIQVHLAYLKRDINESMYHALLEAGRNSTQVKLEGQPLTCSFLRLWDIELTGIVALGKARERADSVQPVVVYIPDDPVCALKTYESSAAFSQALRDRLLQEGYETFFQRFVPARQRAQLFAKLTQCLRPTVWNKAHRWYEPQTDTNARLHLREQGFSIGLLTALTEQKARVFKDDALFHAVPTADEDQKTLSERVHYFESLALQTLNAVGLVVPPVGAVMMGVAAAQLGAEVFEGIDSWTRGEWQQGWAYLMDVAENLALIAALGAAGGGTPAVETITVETPSFIEELKEVALPDTDTRLWKPDMAPFAHDTVLPEGLQPDEFGIYRHQGKTWVSLEGKVYSVKQGTATEPTRVEHPTGAMRYEPPLRSNGAGGWLHPADQPLEWEGLALFRRLGPNASQVSDLAAQRILSVTDTSEAVLRRLLAEHQRPPALLEDTLRRFRLDEAIQREADSSQPRIAKSVFNARYRALSEGQEPLAVPITGAYPDLPPLIADELVRHASSVERNALSNGNVPMRIAQEVRVYQQQVRLARAYEGVYLESVDNPDTDALILHTLAQRPGWSSELRLEVHEGRLNGRLIDSIGPADSALRKTLVKVADGYEAYDHSGLALHGRDDLYASVLHALPDAQRAALGFPGTWDGPTLKLAIQNGQTMPRAVLRTLLNMQPRTPGRKSPMRLADGRLGYPLSGRGVLQGFIARDTLLDLIGFIGLPNADRSAEQLLTALENAGLTRQQIHQRLVHAADEREALDASLATWGDASASIPNLDLHSPSRTRIHDAIWRHWSENTLLEIAPQDSALRLHQIVLSDFPETLPDFFQQRVSRLELIDLSIGRPSLALPQPVSQSVDDRLALERFFARFPSVQALEITRTDVPAAIREPLVFQLPYLIARSFPALRTLRLINQSVWISVLEVQSLSALEHLEWLDLSGNEASFIVPSNLLTLRLRYLGLDNIGLDHWPSWLDGLATADIAEVSLRHNRITDIPAEILGNQTVAGARIPVSLQGNPLSRVALTRVRLSEDSNSRFSFNLDVPAHLNAHIAVLRDERAQLQEAVDSWAEASSSSRPLSAATTEVRHAIGQRLMDFWRAYTEGQTFTVLGLERIALADFPRELPDFFQMRVRSLHLTQVQASTAELNRFLSRFPQLTSLEMLGHTQPVADLPSALLNLSHLTTLSLRDQGRVIDQSMMAFLGRLTQVETLDLSGNRLGTLPDNLGLSANLRWLCLNNVGLDHWPQWLDELLPIEGVMLDNNQLTELPEAILQNPRNDNAQTEISVRGNPLSYETMRRAHLSEHYRSSYSFMMDLPDEIEALSPERHYSDSDAYVSDSDSSGSLASPAGPVPRELPDVEQWLLGSVEENAAHREVWQRVVARGDATDLMALIGRLTQTAPYRMENTRTGFTERMWRVLEAADQHQESRLLYNGIAQEALVQPDTGFQTCHDGAWLVFNQIEIQMFIEQSVRDVPAELRGQSLYQLTRRLYRLNELDAIAREQAGGRDEAEVRLAYRLRWATELDLPLPPSNMLYQVHASIRPSELDTALARVQQGEHGDAFVRYASQRDFWVEYLRETYAERFEALKQDYLARVLALPDRFPGRAIDELGEEFAALKRDYEALKLNLIRELTYREGLDHS